MREIKFKAQNDKGNWVYFSIWDVNPPLKSENFRNLCEFTGLLDVKGNEIYEGDILKYDNPKYPNHKPYVVRWSEEDCCFECVNKENFMLPSVWRDMGIIGNELENPELLKDVN